MQTSLFFVALSSFISLSIGLSFYDHPFYVTLTLQSGDIQSQIEFLLELEALRKGLKNWLSPSIQHCGTKSRKTSASCLGSILSKADCSFEPLCKRRYLASAIREAQLFSPTDFTFTLCILFPCTMDFCSSVENLVSYKITSSVDQEGGVKRESECEYPSTSE